MAVVETALYGEARAKEEAVRRAVAAERAAKREAERARVARAREWGDEEVRLLEKALERFPQARSCRSFSGERWAKRGVCLGQSAMEPFLQAQTHQSVPRVSTLPLVLMLRRKARVLVL